MYRDTWEISVLSSSFSCEPKTALRNRSLKKRYKMKEIKAVRQSDSSSTRTSHQKPSKPTLLLISLESIEIKNGVKVRFLAEIKRSIGFDHDLPDWNYKWW